MFSREETALTLALLLPVAACSHEPESHPPLRAEAVLKIDPIEHGKVLANGRDPGILMVVDGSAGDSLETRSRIKVQSDNYMVALEDLYGHFPKLADLVSGSDFTIFGAADVPGLAKQLIAKMDPDGVRDESDGHQTGMTLSTINRDTGRIRHFVLLSDNSLSTLASTIMVLGHELAHIEKLTEVGILNYAKMPDVDREIDAYQTHSRRMREMLETWERRYGADSDHVKDLRAMIADHENMLEQYRSGSRSRR